MKYFVTGTDTDVGKTLVSAWLCMHLRADYWKPVQCGFDGTQGDREVVERLAGAKTYPERYRFALPRSPHVAAEAAGERIELASFRVPDTPRLIVEGAGGVLVPLNERETMLDLITLLGLPVIVVARGTLGGINHLLLTLAALRAAGREIVGVIFSGPVLTENFEAAASFGATRVLARLPQFDRVDGPALRAVTVPELASATAKTAA